MNCILCDEDAGLVILRNKLFRIILVDDKNYPGFIRLILNNHVKEMSDLVIEDANIVFSSLLKIEKIIRELYNPDKINLASLGNMVPHLHWHIIPRYKSDLHYPNPIWGEVTNNGYKPNSIIIKLQNKLISEIQSKL
jgi:diadenosine tetraphosphate (Ap4A) HIT family hydrolase